MILIDYEMRYVFDYSSLCGRKKKWQSNFNILVFSIFISLELNYGSLIDTAFSKTK